MCKALPFALAGVVALMAALPAQAYHHHRHYYSGVSVGWGGGYWYQGWHGGRGGWWWVVGPSWYYYPEPIYPYPERIVVEERVPAMSGPPPAQSWYYCRPTDSYYPYVSGCAQPWEQVPATPPEEAAKPAPKPAEKTK